jgi:hypothetical protein
MEVGERLQLWSKRSSFLCASARGVFTLLQQGLHSLIYGLAIHLEEPKVTHLRLQDIIFRTQGERLRISLALLGLDCFGPL